MTDRMTGVYPRTPDRLVSGIQEHGRLSRAEMLAKYRRYYQRQLEQAERALSLTDDELIVETYLGSIVNRNRQEVTE